MLAGSLGRPAAPASWLGSMDGVAGEEFAQHVAELVVLVLVRVVGHRLASFVWATFQAQNLR